MPLALVPKNVNTRGDFATVRRINTWTQLLEAALAYFLTSDARDVNYVALNRMKLKWQETV